MVIAAAVLTYPVLISGWLIYLLALAIALRYAPYKALAADPRKQHFVFAASLVLTLFWLLEIEVTSGCTIHPLLVTATVLIIGWSLTLLTASASLILTAALGQSDWAAFPINALFTFVIPATISWVILNLITSLRFKNLFIYMLGAGFAGAAVAVAATSLFAMLLFSLLESPLLPELEISSLPLILLIMFPEAFINGTLVTAMTVFFPDLVKTFDDHHYLDKP